MVIFGGPPQQKRERKGAGRGKGKQVATRVVARSALGRLNERPQHAQIRYDAAMSTTDLVEQGSGVGQGQGDGGKAPRGTQGVDQRSRHDAPCSQAVSRSAVPHKNTSILSPFSVRP